MMNRWNTFKPFVLLAFSRYSHNNVTVHLIYVWFLMAFSFSKILTYLPLLTITYFYTNKQTNRKLTFATNA